MRTLARDFAMSVSPKQEAARHPDHNLCLSRVRHNAGETSGRQANRRQISHPANPVSQSVMAGLVPAIHVFLAEPL